MIFLSSIEMENCGDRRSGAIGKNDMQAGGFIYSTQQFGTFDGFYLLSSNDAEVIGSGSLALELDGKGIAVW